ncbi:MAG: phosphatase PAP2 family protein [Planctomycetes bacterium]|nr:phosphatase PAP2 family protein [Planctomycetota bacterium]MBL7009412.1 phosphatase PAP2 family protein [Planctomycetota bacterium]
MAVEADLRTSSLSTALPAFCGAMVLLVLLTPGRVEDPVRAVGSFTAVAAIALATEQLQRRLPRLRSIVVPFVAGGLLFAIYSFLSMVIPWVLPDDREWLMLRADRAWFGYHWESVWAGLVHPLLSDLLQAVYTSFYVFPFLLGVRWAWRKDWPTLYQGVDRVIAGFLISYCGYLLVPTRSPYAFLEYAQALPTYGLQPFLHEQLINTSWTKRDCFPSGHVMMSSYVAWLCWVRDRAWFWIFGPWAALTAVATLYLRYHYLVDVLAGLLFFLAWVWLSERLWGRFRDLPFPGDPRRE